MAREISRRTSRPPEMKGIRTSRPDRPGRRDLDPRIVEDRPDPALPQAKPQLNRIIDDLREEEVIQIGRDMDNYLGSINPTEGS